jgi:hypothetical protein
MPPIDKVLNGGRLVGGRGGYVSNSNLRGGGAVPSAPRQCHLAGFGSAKASPPAQHATERSSAAWSRHPERQRVFARGVPQPGPEQTERER